MHRGSALGTAPNLTNDFKVDRFPQAIVKFNARPDLRELRRRVNLVNNGQKPLFPLNTLEGDLANAHILLEEREPAFRIANDPFGDIRLQERTMLNQNNAMEVFTQLNGLIGSTPEQIDDQIEFACWTEMANAESRSAQLNGIAGGAFNILYNGVDSCRANAYLRVRVPTPAEADKMKSDKVAQARGTKGIVTAMYEEYNPLTSTFLSPEGLAYCLNKTKADVEKTAGLSLSAWAMANKLAAIYDLIKGENGALKMALADDDKEAINLMNEFVQLMAEYRLKDDRRVVCRTHHPAANGNYVSVQALRYGC